MSDINTEPEWRFRACELVDKLVTSGILTDRQWQAAFATIPRHVFVSRFYHGNDVVDSGDPQRRGEWLNAVYRDDSLITQQALVPETELLWSTSSSTKPSLMARMLHLLDVRDGHRVLEIGTGTGYNAALLCHRLNDTAVYSVDVDPDLVSQARQRLAQLGYHPTLITGDGSAGSPGHAPFDRIIATCAVAAVPPAWISQLAASGLIVADVRGDLASTLTVLRKIDQESVQGRVLREPGHFMWLRAQRDNPLRDGGTLGLVIDHDHAQQRNSQLDPTVLDQVDVRFIVQLADRTLQHPWRATNDGQPVVWCRAEDGSWAEVRAVPQDGRYAVTQGGPRRIWDLVEDAVNRWRTAGEPTRDRFGVTAKSDGTHNYWLDAPDTTWKV